jgi:hypothetical protein
MTYAAYLRIYEPVAAFHEPDRSRWAAYAASACEASACEASACEASAYEASAVGPRRRDSLSAEHAEALRRAIAAPQVVVPDQESEHAYIRRAGGVTYVCPWQTRLRCLLSYGRMLSMAGSAPPGTIPVGDERQAKTALARLAGEGLRGPATRLHILASVWTIPLAWFVPFAATERWMALGPDERRTSAAPIASATRALVYTTPMSQARRRVARGLAALRGLAPGCDDARWDPVRAEAELTEVGRWLEDFHPYSLVELDYGGLVHLLSDEALSNDQSAAEIGAAVDEVAKGECELAVSMYRQVHARWRTFAEFEMAN